MLLCRGVGIDTGGLLRNLVGSAILLLPGDGDIATGASPKSANLEQPMQIHQSIRREAGRPDRHYRANSSVEHPLREYCCDARFELNVHDASTGALLTVLGSDRTPEKGMPRIVNYNFSPNMGGMTA